MSVAIETPRRRTNGSMNAVTKRAPCLGLVIAMLATGAPVSASEPPESAVADLAVDTREVARAQFQAGLARYEAADYAGAIQSWTLAHGSMATDAPERPVLGLDLAQAHVRAYRIDGDRSHFDPAERLIDEYIAWVDRPGHTMDAAEQEDRPRALEMLAFLEDQRAARAGAPVVAPRVAPRASTSDAIVDRPSPSAPTRSRKVAHILVATGAASLGLAAGAGIGLVVLSRRSPQLEREYEQLAAENHESGQHEPTPELEAIERRGRRVNAGIIATAAGVAVFGVTGIALLTTGLVTRRRALRATPTLGAGYAGLSVSGRF